MVTYYTLKNCDKIFSSEEFPLEFVDSDKIALVYDKPCTEENRTTVGTMTKSFKKRLNKERKNFENTFGINGESSNAGECV